MTKGGFIEDFVIQFCREMPTQESRIHEFQEEQTKVQGQQGSNHQYNGQITETEEIITRDSHANQNQNQVRVSSSILYKKIILYKKLYNQDYTTGFKPIETF